MRVEVREHKEVLGAHLGRAKADVVVLLALRSCCTGWRRAPTELYVADCQIVRHFPLEIVRQHGAGHIDLLCRFLPTGRRSRSGCGRPFQFLVERLEVAHVLKHVKRSATAAPGANKVNALHGETTSGGEARCQRCRCECDNPANEAHHQKPKGVTDLQ